MSDSIEALRAVFVDVDTQVDFVEPDGALYVPGAERLKPAFARLIAAASEHGSPTASRAPRGSDESRRPSHLRHASSPSTGPGVRATRRRSCSRR